MYKEIQTVPGQGKATSADNDDFDADFAFKRRRRRRRRSVSIDGSIGDEDGATHSSFVIARECHFTDDSKSASPLPSTAPSAAADHSSKVRNVPETGHRPKVSQSESRFVPINAEPWRNGGRNFADFGGRIRSPLSMLNSPNRAFMSADESQFQKEQFIGHTPNVDASQNGQAYHKFPFPHYHIYYNRPGVQQSMSIDGSNDGMNVGSNTNPIEHQHHNHHDHGSTKRDETGTFNSPNSYFEFTNPNGGHGMDEPNFQSNNHDDDEDGSNDDDGNSDSENDDGSNDGSDGGNGDEQNDDSDMNNAPSTHNEERSARNRRGKLRYRGFAQSTHPHPHPQTL